MTERITTGFSLPATNPNPEKQRIFIQVFFAHNLSDWTEDLGRLDLNSKAFQLYSEGALGRFI